MWIWLLLGVFLSSFLVTGLYRRYALHKLIVDIPNNRSSHTKPTPRGGGVAIVITFSAALWLFQSQLGLSLNHLLGFLIPAIMLSTVSFIDDHGHVKARWRLLAQFSAASVGLYLLGGVASLRAADVNVQSPLILSVIFTLLLVWLVNLYNFMDGIDGIASLQAIVVSTALAIILWLLSPNEVEFIIPLLLMSATAGFLCWNFPKAKIFMGDIGSCFIGLMIGLFTIHFMQFNSELFWCAVIMLGTFVVDASVTLFRRMFRGEKIHVAHREHAYQHSAQVYGHVLVSIAYALIAILWLFPLALLAAFTIIDGFIVMLIAYIPLIMLAVRLRAGLPELAA